MGYACSIRITYIIIQVDDIGNGLALHICCACQGQETLFVLLSIKE